MTSTKIADARNKTKTTDMMIVKSRTRMTSTKIADARNKTKTTDMMIVKSRTRMTSTKIADAKNKTKATNKINAKRMIMFTVNANNAGILIAYSDVDAGNFDRGGVLVT